MKTSLPRIMLTLLLSVCAIDLAFAIDIKGLDKGTRCSVCGMFVAKYPEWVCQIIMSDGSSKYFDGVKDMMAFSFSPQKYGADAGTTPNEYLVKDYYTLTSVDGKKAFFVVGSDTTGPMGSEFIPFATKEAAEAFSKDHQGKKILPFTEITADLVESMRSGQTMK
ncbi:MAG: nitrous oxide reductase accessory protein NosL [Proteobacteria bacterium]|nr:hypothetical protein [Desulfobulbaceae bacterium]MBU4151464.1 nitrous oxide reductase accessory protein NosL [Pseudomonadota bacterium]